MPKKAPDKTKELPGLRGPHHLSQDGSEVVIDGHRFKRTVLPSPNKKSLKQQHIVDDMIAEIEQIDQPIAEV